MEETEYGHLVGELIQLNIPTSEWRRLADASVDGTVKKYLESIGLQVELDKQTTVFYLSDNVLVRLQ